MNNNKIILDKYYTKKSVAVHCFNKVVNILKNEINIDDYTFIEPAMGSGVFYDLLPKDKRIGIDIHPTRKETIAMNYLDYFPKKKNKNIVIGNPPFGNRGQLALDFINHSQWFADVVCFILPQLFISDGKSVPRKRVKGYNLIYNEYLPSDSFETAEGKEILINTVFQVWTKLKINSLLKEEKRTCNQYIKLYSLSNGLTSSQKRNVKMIGNCDLYLPSTAFQNIKIYKEFNNLPNKRGYGIIIKKDKKKIFDTLLNINWQNNSFKSTNSANNLRFSIIKNALIEKGYYDD